MGKSKKTVHTNASTPGSRDMRRPLGRILWERRPVLLHPVSSNASESSSQSVLLCTAQYGLYEISILIRVVRAQRSEDR